MLPQLTRKRAFNSLLASIFLAQTLTPSVVYAQSYVELTAEEREALNTRMAGEHSNLSIFADTANGIVESTVVNEDGDGVVFRGDPNQTLRAEDFFGDVSGYSDSNSVSVEQLRAIGATGEGSEVQILGNQAVLNRVDSPTTSSTQEIFDHVQQAAEWQGGVFDSVGDIDDSIFITKTDEIVTALMDAPTFDQCTEDTTTVAVQRTEKLEDFRFCSVQNAVAQSCTDLHTYDSEYTNLQWSDIFQIDTRATAPNSRWTVSVDGNDPSVLWVAGTKAERPAVARAITRQQRLTCSGLIYFNPPHSSLGQDDAIAGWVDGIGIENVVLA